MNLLRTVRARTTLAASVAVALALAVGALVLLRTLDHSLSTAADQQSRDRLSTLLEQARGGTLPRRVAGISDDSLAQVVAADGRVIASSPNVEGRPAVASVTETSPTPSARTMRGLPDDQETEDYRVWSARVTTPAGPVAAFVGPSLEATHEATDRLGQTLAVGLPLLLLFLALAIWVAVGRALRPVEAVRREVGDLDSRSLHRRVPVPRTHDEVARLARTMNAMLDRLEAADLSQREFVANASHDLQSPLTVLRTELEVALAGADLEEWRGTGHRLLAETDGMEALVGDLLFLAQAEDGGAVAHVPLDLEDLVGEEVARMPVRPDLDVVLHASPTPVRGHRQQLTRMVRNLLLNAAGFAGGRVEVEVGVEGSQAVLVVQDDGPGVPAEEREHVFERFVMLDSARERRGGGTGLGLAIVRTIALAHGGTVRLEGRSRFVVRLPVLG